MSSFETTFRKVCSPTTEIISFLISLSNSKIISGSIEEPKKNINFFLSLASSCSMMLAISPELKSDNKLCVLSTKFRFIESIKALMNFGGTGAISFFNLL